MHQCVGCLRSAQCPSPETIIQQECAKTQRWGHCFLQTLAGFLFAASPQTLPHFLSTATRTSCPQQRKCRLRSGPQHGRTLPDFLSTASPHTLPDFLSTAPQKLLDFSCPQRCRKLCLTALLQTSPSSCPQRRHKLSFLTSCPQRRKCFLSSSPQHDRKLCLTSCQ